MMNKTLKTLPVLLISAPLFFLTACGTMGDNTGDDAASVEDRSSSGQSEGYEGQTGGCTVSLV